MSTRTTDQAFFDDATGEVSCVVSDQATTCAAIADVHVRDGLSEDAFVKLRKRRDAQLDVPTHPVGEGRQP